MSEAESLLQRLIASQNADGGWSYAQGSSWAEPTALSLLALQASLHPSAQLAQGRALGWLLASQKPSGGWPPHPQVNECTAVTSLCSLALLSSHPAPTYAPQLQSALAWTASHVYRDELTLSAVLSKVFDVPPAHAPGSVAWYPGTAGWVTPTSLSTLTLLRASREMNRAEFKQIALHSCQYLLSRRCIDHGWNHGGSKTRSEDATSYPETTGIALLALRAAGIASPPEAVSLATRFAASPESTEGLAWIELALARGTVASPSPSDLPIRTTRDCALRLLSLAGSEGRNIFLEPVA